MHEPVSLFREYPYIYIIKKSTFLFDNSFVHVVMLISVALDVFFNPVVSSFPIWEKSSSSCLRLTKAVDAFNKLRC